MSPRENGAPPSGARIVGRGIGYGAALGAGYGSVAWIGWGFYASVVDGYDEVSTGLVYTVFAAAVGASIGWVLGLTGGIVLAVARGRRGARPGAAAASGGVVMVALVALGTVLPHTSAYWWSLGIFGVSGATAWLATPWLLRPVSAPRCWTLTPPEETARRE